MQSVTKGRGSKCFCQLSGCQFQDLLPWRWKGGGGEGYGYNLPPLSQLLQPLDVGRSALCITLMVLSFPLLQRTRCVLGLHFRERERETDTDTWFIVKATDPYTRREVQWGVGEGVNVYYTSALSSTI